MNDSKLNMRALRVRPVVVKHSHVLIPSTPGSGIRWDERAVKQYAA